ncbi:MAG: hypothetical protein QM703_23735 [Gemmatales bacterium]
MAKAHPKKKHLTKQAVQELPFLSSAFICEKVLLEERVHSAIRMVDTLNLQQDPSELPDFNDPKFEGLELPLVLFVGFRAGKARGDFECKIIVRSPGGLQLKYGSMKFTVNNDATDSTGAIANLPVKLKWEKAGLYWFEIWMKDKLITQVPLNVVVNKQLQK